MELVTIDRLNKYQKVFLTYKVFDYWNKGKIKYSNEVFYPKDIELFNIDDVMKVYLFCSNIKEDNVVDELINYFDKLTFYEQLDFMIYLFDIVNDIKIIPNYITDEVNLKNLSDKILQYKLLK